MNLYTLQPLAGPSLYCSQPCLLMTFFLDGLASVAASQSDHSVILRAGAELEKIDLQLPQLMPDSNRPISIDLIRALIQRLMQRLEIDCGPDEITQVPGNRILIAVPQKERIATVSAAKTAIKYILALYKLESAEGLKHGTDHLAGLKQLISSINFLTKSRVTKCIQASLRAENKPWLALDTDVRDKNLYQIGFGVQQRLMRGSVSFESAHIGVQISGSKIKTLQFLSQLGFPTPQQAAASDINHACQLADTIGYPVVVKAEFGTRGEQVYADLRSQQELIDAVQALQQFQQRNRPLSLLVEKYIAGTVYRLEIIDGELFDAYEMIHAGIEGDGVHSVSELVAIENKNPGRKPKSDPTGTFVSLKLTAMELLVLKKQGLTEHSIPEKGQIARLSSTSNWSRGGTYNRVTQRVHPDNKKLVERLATALKINLIGIDLIAEDIGQSFIDGEVNVIEVNHAPDMGDYFDIAQNKFIDVSKRIVEKLVPELKYGDVPVITFKSAPLANQAEQLVARLFNHIGSPAGVSNQQGIIINGQVWASIDQVDKDHPELQLLRNETVAAAIIDLSSEYLADVGLGHGGCDITVILNAQEQKIVSTRWPQGLAANRLDIFLIESARLAAIVFVEDKQGIELCLTATAEKQYALFTDNLPGIEKLISAGVHCIELIAQREQALLIRISRSGSSYEQSLAVKSEAEPLVVLTAVAVCLTLAIDIKHLQFVI
ncbi:MAG: hypothetical protein P8P79_18105 [Halioglobus sp.]|nr:hypothetical protein [Halioglobus sp.]